MAAVCAISINKPGRRGDVGNWRLGDDLVRDPCGTWRLEWTQQKTGHETEAGALWPEVSEILDAYILGGRPERLVHLRYRELGGRYFTTLSEKTAYAKLPTELTKAAIGVPIHDLRTLASDYVRAHDPEAAAGIISAHLGHSSKEAGKAYGTECLAEAGSQAWQRVREQLATVGGA